MKEYNHALIAELVTHYVRTSDSNSFAQLYALTYNKIYNYSYNYLKDRHLAQDALQEIYIRALKNISTLTDPTLFIAWLNRIAFNVCYDMSKDLSKEQVYSPELMEIMDLTDPADTPEKHYEKLDEHTALSKAIESLPFLEKQVIVLRFFQNMKLEEIASALSISRSSVKRYIASSQEHLKNILNEKEAR